MVQKDSVRPVDKVKTIAVDLDATLAEYDGWQGEGNIGQPLEGARDFLQELSDKGLYIIIHTARLSVAKHHLYDFESLSRVYHHIKDWLRYHQMPYNEIYTGQGKPDAKAFVDDRGVSCRPQDDKNAYKSALESIYKLVKE